MHTVPPKLMEAPTVHLLLGQPTSSPVEQGPPADPAAEATIVLPRIDEATVPLTLPPVEPSPQITAPAPLPKRQRLELGEEPVSMLTLDVLGRRGQSNGPRDPHRTALLQAVGKLDAAGLEAFASGSDAEISPELFEAASASAVKHARTFARNLWKNSQEQHIHEPDPSTFNPERLNGLMRGSAAGRKDSSGGGAPLPLPVRDPGEALRQLTRPRPAISRERAGAFRLGDHHFVESDTFAAPTVDPELTQIITPLHRGDSPTIVLPKDFKQGPGQYEVVDEEATLVLSPLDLAAAGVAQAVRTEVKRARPEISGLINEGVVAVRSLLSRLKLGSDKYIGRHRDRRGSMPMPAYS